MKNRSAIPLIAGHLKHRAVACFLVLTIPISTVTMANTRRGVSLARENAGSNRASKQDADMRLLEPGEPAERELRAGESHSYQITLAAGQYLGMVVEHHGISIVVAVFGPTGTQLLETNNATGSQGQQSFSFITELAGSYRIKVRPAEKNAAAGRYELRITALREPTKEDRGQDEARRLSQESLSLRKKGKYDEALPFAQRALAIRESVLGPEDPLVADSLHDLAVLYDDKSDYVKAEPLNLRALAIREKTLGPNHPDVAKSLNNLAWIYAVRLDFAKAESFYRRALGIQENALGANNPELATTLNDLALLYFDRGDYDQAIQIDQRVLAIREKALGPDDSGVAKALNNLAQVYERKGEYSRSELLYQRSLLIWEKALGPDHPEVAFAIDGLARAYYFEGEYYRAEPLFQRALAIREKALGPDHSDTITTTNNLAMLYLRMGDYARPEPLFRRVIAAWERKFGPDHPSVATPANNLANLYESLGDYEKAEPLYRRALAIREKAFGANHVAVGESLNNLGQLYLKSRKDDARAELLFQRARDVMEKALGPDYPGVAVPLSNLARLCERRGDDAQAELFYSRALAIRETALGPDQVAVAESLDSLARLYVKRGDIQKALSLSVRSNRIRERDLARNLEVGSERQKLGYLKVFEEETDNALSLHALFAPTDQEALALAFTTLLQRKGRALDAMSDDISVLRSRAGPQDRDLFNELSDARSLLANVTLRGPNKNESAAFQARLKQLEERIDNLEGEISARSAEFRARSLPITLAGIRQLIPDKAALIEFASYRPNDPRTSRPLAPRYSAYMLTSQGPPRWADLGEAAPIDTAINLWRRALRDPERADASRLARAVDEKLMQPVRALLGPENRLLISPDGPLNLIPFAALVDERGKFLVERYSITYLTSGRDLLRLQVARDSKGPPVVVADPAFGEPALMTSTGSVAERTQVDYSQVFFGPLPGVSDEVRALRQLLPQATFLTREQATKAALKRVRGPSVLHIATHGFFLQDDSPTGDTIAKNTRLGKWVAHVENPLLRSGIALAGANAARNGNDDGILTSLEVAGLDLWGTKLVVLSACNTGVGVVKVGDGVYGLRRALVLAGAEAQMISLWPVSDRSTRDLMIGYYRLLTKGLGRGEALRQVQLQMLRSKARGHPYYWSSFIQSGEWANLEGNR